MSPGAFEFFPELKGLESEDVKKQGAYVLYIDVNLSLTASVGSLRTVSFPCGRYAYVGSASKGVAGRIARHKRLAEQKTGKLHWHIDYLLIHPNTVWAGEIMLEDGNECAVSKQIAAMKGVTAPVPGFGSTDCRAGCEAHLYRLPENS